MNSSITVSNIVLPHEQLYNCDEISLNFKIIPSKILTSYKENQLLPIKEAKNERLVAGVVPQETNCQLKLACIGKSTTKSCAFKSIASVAPSVQYNSQNKCVYRNFSNWFL